MTILSVVQNVCLAVGIAQPDQVFASTDREMQEMARFANEAAQHILNVEFDWQALQVIRTMTGDGFSEAFDLPEDYSRMLATAGLWSNRWSWSFEPITSLEAWLEMQAVPFVAVNGQWIIFGDQLHILPVVGNAETVKFGYISKNIVKPNTGTNKPAFDADTDSFRLSERVLELCIIWKWLAQKGFPSDDAQDEYDRALYSAMNKDTGSKPILSGNRPRYGRGSKWAFPYTVGGA